MTASSSSPALSPDQGPPADLPGIADRVRAIMLAGALADALTAQPEPAQAPAAPPEGVSTAAGGQVLGIPSPGAAQGGSPGAGAASGGAAATIADAAAVSGPTTLQLQPLRISADTQLSLYTMDGLLESIEWASAGEAADETACQWLAQLRWLRTQDVEWPESAPSPLPRWIDAHQVLHADHGHQGQTLEALLTGSMGLVERPVLPEAQDRTAVIRSIPYGLLPVGWRSIAPLSIDAAAITHGRAEAQTAATALALMLQAAQVEGCRGSEEPVRTAAESALDVLGRLTRPTRGTSELLQAVLDGRDPDTAAGVAQDADTPQGQADSGAAGSSAGPDRDTSSRTLAIGLRCALEAEQTGASAPELWKTAVAAAQREQGSDARGSAPLAAALIAAAHGGASLEAQQIGRLEAREVIEEACQRWVQLLGLTG